VCELSVVCGVCGCALSVVYGCVRVLEGVYIRDDCSHIARK